MFTKNIMWAVNLALIPAGAAGVFIFGIHSLYVIMASILSAMITEWAILAIRKKEIAILDGSAILTGLLLAYNLPPGVPLWLPVIGSAFAIAIGKQAFGGMRHNIFNPALLARAFLMFFWPVYMATWQNPRWKVDAITTATPLTLFKHNQPDLLKGMTHMDLFLGNRGGCIGEVCIAALLIGAAYLFWKKYLSWHIPLTYIAAVAILSWAFNGSGGLFTGDALFFVLSGGLMLGALFMATDYVTSPVSKKGKIIFGISCGILTFVIRKFSVYPEGTLYAILIMNAFVPLIDKFTHRQLFGWSER